MPIRPQREVFDGTFFDEFGISGREERTLSIVAETCLDSVYIAPDRNEYKDIIFA